MSRPRPIGSAPGPEGGTEEQAQAQGRGRFHVHLDLSRMTRGGSATRAAALSGPIINSEPCSRNARADFSSESCPNLTPLAISPRSGCSEAEGLAAHCRSLVSRRTLHANLNCYRTVNSSFRTGARGLQ